MARPIGVNSTKNIKVLIKKENSFGAKNIDNMYAPSVISYELPFNSTALEVSSDLSGVNTQTNAVSRKDTKMFTTTISMIFDHTAHMLVNESGLMGAINKDKIYDDNTTFTLVFTNANHSENDVVMRGSAITSIVLKEDVASETGLTICDITFMSGFDIGVNTVAISHTSLTTNKSKIFDTVMVFGSQELFPMSWELTITQPLERVGYDINFNPLKYVLSGVYEITGSLSVKQDEGIANITSLLEGVDDSNTLEITNDTNYNLRLEAIVDQATADVGGSYILNTIPFRCIGETPAVLAIHGASAEEQENEATPQIGTGGNMGGGY